MKIIDIHTHAFPNELAPRAMNILEERSSGFKAFLNGTVSDLLRSMDEAGIEISVINSIATKPTQVKPILEWSKKIRSDRIIPFASIHPANENFKEIITMIQDAGIPGIKLHPQYQDFVLDDEKLFPLYEALAASSLVVAFHAGFDSAFPEDLSAHPGRMVNVVERFPELTIIATHLGGWRDWENVSEKLAGKKVNLETSFTVGLIDEKILYSIFEKHPTERILFGTDSPWTEQKASVRDIENLPLSKNDKEKIFHLNAKRLLGL